MALGVNTFRDGVSYPEVVSAELDSNTNPPKRVTRLNPVSGPVVCVNMASGNSSTTLQPQYGYYYPVPSPDGKWVLVHRLELSTIANAASAATSGSSDRRERLGAGAG
jgi:hypothetical protein